MPVFSMALTHIQQLQKTRLRNRYPQLPEHELVWQVYTPRQRAFRLVTDTFGFLVILVCIVGTYILLA